jgi:hypothetical protein
MGLAGHSWLDRLTWANLLKALSGVRMERLDEAFEAPGGWPICWGPWQGPTLWRIDHDLLLWAGRGGECSWRTGGH